MTSETLENVYLEDRDTEIPFSAGKQKYILHFKDATGDQVMYQQNIKFKTKRDVRRRPRFVSAHDVEDKLKRYFDFHLCTLIQAIQIFLVLVGCCLK